MKLKMLFNWLTLVSIVYHNCFDVSRGHGFVNIPYMGEDHASTTFTVAHKLSTTVNFLEIQFHHDKKCDWFARSYTEVTCYNSSYCSLLRR